jgi:hypothetical protein
MLRLPWAGASTCAGLHPVGPATADHLPTPGSFWTFRDAGTVQEPLFGIHSGPPWVAQRILVATPRVSPRAKSRAGGGVLKPVEVS